MAAVNPLTFEATSVWLSRQKYEEAESVYQIYIAGGRPQNIGSPSPSPTKPKEKKHSGGDVKSEMANMRSKISDVLSTNTPPSRGKSPSADSLGDRVQLLEKENKNLVKELSDIRTLVQALEKRIVVLEGGAKSTPAIVQSGPAESEGEESDDDLDLFDDDSAPDAKAQEEYEKLKEQRVKSYEEKKNKKPKTIAKSNLILDVKPWGDDTDMKELERCVRSIEMDGLLWGASKLVAVGYGIQKLQISCVIEDDKIFTDDIEEQIVAFEDYVQSMDIAAFNKV